MKKTLNKFLSVILAAMVLIGVLPITASAATDTRKIFLGLGESDWEFYAEEECITKITEIDAIVDKTPRNTVYFRVANNASIYTPNTIAIALSNAIGYDKSTELTFADGSLIPNERGVYTLKFGFYDNSNDGAERYLSVLSSSSEKREAMLLDGKNNFLYGQNLYYGQYDVNSDKVNEIVKWRVLGEGDVGNTWLMLSDQLLEISRPFDENIRDYQDVEIEYTASNNWNWSNALEWCDAFESDSLSESELAAIEKVTLNDPAYDTKDILISGNYAQVSVHFNAFGEYADQQVFFLSAQEVDRYMPVPSERSTHNANGVVYDWWLRSKLTNSVLDGDSIINLCCVGTVSLIGETTKAGYISNGALVTKRYAYRPAFYLDASKVLMVTAPSNNATPSFGEISTYSGNDWVLTLGDSKSFRATGYTGTTTLKEGYDATQITINHYSLDNALYHATAESIYNQVTATLTDSSGKILYYGRINSNTSATQSTVTVPTGLVAGNYTLSIRGETWQGKTNTTRVASGTAYDIPIIITTAEGYRVTEDEPTVQLGTSALSGYTETYGYDYIAYGNDKLDWRVLDTTTNTGEEGVFLLSENILAAGVPFSASGNTYSASTADTWAAGFASADNFTEKELAAMLATTKSDEADSFTLEQTAYSIISESNILSNDKIFMLSYAEATSAAYGLENGSKRKATFTDGTELGYWLRSAIDSSSLSFPLNLVSLSALVGTDGIVSPANATLTYVNDGQTTTYFGYRPAVNIDTDKILFTLAADGSAEKNFGKIETASNRNWKLTLSTDDGFNSIINTDMVYPGQTVTVSHTSLPEGYDTVTAMLFDSNRTPIAYGKLSDAGEENVHNLTIPNDLANGTYTLKIYAEDWNDGTTNYATGNVIAKTITVDAAYIHTHNYTYSANGAVITESCSCGHEETATLVTDFEGTAIYNGNEYKAKVIYSDDWAGDKTAEIEYYKNRIAPIYQVYECKAAGNYIATISIDNKLAQLSYTIERRKPDITAPTVSQIVLGTRLSEMPLTGGSASGVNGENIAGHFEWYEGGYTMDVLGYQTVQVKFISLPTNYGDVVFDIEVKVVICDTASGEHEFSVPQNDGTHHWNKCVGCDATDTKIEHSGTEDGDCTTEVKCSCGAVVTAAMSHKFDNACDTDCNNDGCTYTKTTEHTPNADDGDCTTAVRCAVCDAITTEARSDHSGGTATCTAKAKCEVCNTEYGEAIGHGETEIRNAKTASCTEEGYTGDTYCKVCGEKLKDGTAIAKTAHTYENGNCTACDAKEQSYSAESPKTGENFNIRLWFSLMLASGFALSVASSYSKKRKSC